METQTPSEPQEPINQSRRNLTKGGMAFTVVAASLVTKNALACAPRHLTCSGKLSGNTSGHGADGNDGCVTMSCNYSKEKHKADCDSKGEKHRRPVDRDWDTTYKCKDDWKGGSRKTQNDAKTMWGFNTGGNSGSEHSRRFQDCFGTPGNKVYRCKQTSTGSYTKTRKWECEKNPISTTGYDDCTLGDLISWHCKDGRWNTGTASSTDDDCIYAAKCTTLYLNAECDGDTLKNFPLTKQQVKDIYGCIAQKKDYYPDSTSPTKRINYADLKPWVDEICNSGHL